ncbi:MAG TPA: 3'-5' exonuclease [Kiritimatiellia bacterium]|nr:3'-5' exonuclease [Kiritimatiellia bacterium]HMO97528.1 3'-5' exonuclease [Kiritimatiellia bacterium]
MHFRIADTFTDSLGCLTPDEQKATKQTAFDLQINPASPSMSFHKLDKAKDKNFWSVRVSADIRIIVHKTAGSLLLCYVDHHDKAYAWAERRKLETHPKTGAAQFVEIRETVKEIVVPVYVKKQAEPVTAPKPLLFDRVSDEDLLGYGVPSEWIPNVKKVDEDSLLVLAEHLPAEASEALLELATGGKPRPVKTTATADNPFDHPDAQRRFKVVSSAEELQQALEFPWDKWTVFLHPEQRELVEKEFNGPARVAGSAGTGKTIVALHRAVSLARRHPEARVLLTTFSDPLAHALQTKLRRLIGNEPRLAERIDVYSLPALAIRLHKSWIGPITLMSREALRNAIRDASARVAGHHFSLSFLMSEWDQVVDAWQLATWDAYRDVARLGRKTRLPETQRRVLWSIFEYAREDLNKSGGMTLSGAFSALTTATGQQKHRPFDFAVIDESQDISVAQLRFLAALGEDRPNALFFAGDLGQRIFQAPFSWKSLGVDVRGRSKTLRVNYRTSHQIRKHADRLLGPEVADIDGNTEKRSDTVSVFNGVPPVICDYTTEEEEGHGVGAWLKEMLTSGITPHEIGIFVRSAAQIPRAEAAAKAAGLPCRVLDDHADVASGYAAIGTMHLAKGLEFRAVAVMACDDEVLPLQERIEQVGDDADLQEIYDTERHLLYVACTRARDHLMISAVAPASEFLDDLRHKQATW